MGTHCPHSVADPTGEGHSPPPPSPAKPEACRGTPLRDHLRETWRGKKYFCPSVCLPCTSELQRAFGLHSTWEALMEHGNTEPGARRAGVGAGGAPSPGTARQGPPAAGPAGNGVWCTAGRPPRNAAHDQPAGGQTANTPHFLAAQGPGWKQSPFYFAETTRFASRCPAGRGGGVRLRLPGGWAAWGDRPAPVLCYLLRGQAG